MKKYITFIIIGSLIIGFLSGYFIRDIIPTINNIIPKSCVYEGKKYKDGDSFPASDGCNSCGCQQGRVMCTMMACIPN
jgi:hypothetical protein